MNESEAPTVNARAHTHDCLKETKTHSLNFLTINPGSHVHEFQNVTTLIRRTVMKCQALAMWRWTMPPGWQERTDRREMRKLWNLTVPDGSCRDSQEFGPVVSLMAFSVDLGQRKSEEDTVDLCCLCDKAGCACNEYAFNKMQSSYHESQAFWQKHLLPAANTKMVPVAVSWWIHGATLGHAL